MTSVDPVDLLVFGPHPDDLEIGMAGTIAKQTALGHRVGLCDLTEGEMGSNGTVEQNAWPRRRRPRAVLGACWRVNLRPARPRASARAPTTSTRAAALIRRARPRTVALPYWSDRHPGSRRRERDADRSGLQRRAAPVSAPTATPWQPSTGPATTSSTSTCTPSFVVDVSSRCYETQAAARWPATSPSSRRRGPDAVATRLTSARFQQLIESRDAQFGAQIGVAFAEGFVVARAAGAPAPVLVEPGAVMNIGIVCYASVGGSGIVATELGKALADRGHAGALHQHRNAVPAGRVPGRA